MGELATVVLLNWKRHQNIPRIAMWLSQKSYVGEIIVWNNNPEVEFFEEDFPHDIPVRIVCLGRNLGTYGRFLASLKAKHEWIVTVDDDYFPLDIDKAWNAHFNHPDSICAVLPNENGSYHWRVEANKTPWIQLGFGSVYRRQWVWPTLHKWTEQYGEDDLLHSKADRIFTVLFQKHHPILGRVEPLTIGGKRSDRDDNALYRGKDHSRLKKMAVERAMELK